MRRPTWTVADACSRPRPYNPRKNTVGLIPGTRLGPYEVAALIGLGGMGEVYRAHDLRLNRDVALKVLPDAFALDPDRLTRFRREAQVLASLNHPNIATIYGFEESNGVRALVMELVEGPTLADRIARRAIRACTAPRTSARSIAFSATSRRRYVDSRTTAAPARATAAPTRSARCVRGPRHGALQRALSIGPRSRRRRRR